MNQRGKICNISGYKFVDLADPESLQPQLLRACRSRDLKGTILLSHEGINCFLAGKKTEVDSFLEYLRSFAEFADFEAKESFNDYPPFSRMLVKIKSEIITFDVPEVKPAAGSPKKIKPRELKQWLDEGQDIVLLDTRNEYEIDLGTFDGAESVHIDNFREFPEAINRLPESYRQKPVVMFCTGGIRCEKAGPFMEDAGFQNVLQLDGGILKYFEDCGGAHWHGECFVFDKRVALDPDLAETATTICYVCQAVLGQDDQNHPQYRFGISCPKCYQPERDCGPTVLAPEQRNRLIADVCSPLPGSVPYENVRPMTVAREMDAMPLLEFLEALKTHIDREGWIGIIEAGQILYRGKPVGLNTRVEAGQRYYHLIPDVTEPPVHSDIRVIHEDQQLVVVDKPAPIPMHACGRFNRNSLQFILGRVYQDESIRLVHRLDANTTGIVVYGRTRKIASRLAEAFGQGRVEKEYVADVHGRTPEHFASTSRIASTPGVRGIRLPDPKGRFAVTEFETVSYDPDRNISRVIARPRTGRTNQIRIHLWESGHPIVGDPTYLVDQNLGRNRTLDPDEPPMRLHARCIRFSLPDSRTELEFSSPEPDWDARTPAAEKPFQPGIVE